MKTNDQKATPDTRNDVIELGVASIETKGDNGTIEGMGLDPIPGISAA